MADLVQVDPIATHLDDIVGPSCNHKSPTDGFDPVRWREPATVAYGEFRRKERRLNVQFVSGNAGPNAIVGYC